MKYRVTYQVIDLRRKATLPQVVVEVDAKDSKDAKLQAFNAVHNIYGRAYDTTELVTTIDELDTDF